MNMEILQALAGSIEEALQDVSDEGVAALTLKPIN